MRFLAALALFVLFVAAGAASLGVAAASVAPPAAPVAAGVTVGGVSLSGLRSEPARMRLHRAAARSLRFVYGDERWRATPKQLGTGFAVDEAVARALTAPPRASLELRARVPGRAVRRYVASLARRFDRAAEDARLVGLVDGRPSITEARSGIAVDRRALEASITRALRRNSRAAIELAMRPVAPKVERDDFGSIIVIERGANALRLYEGMQPVQSFRVATGTARYPTPAGRFSIVDMQRDPWWRPPTSEWAKDKKPIPPGPGNPLGTRWMGISVPAVGIHGTPDAASIGYSASHGCIRMRVPEAEWLFEQVEIGTTVFIT